MAEQPRREAKRPRAPSSELLSRCPFPPAGHAVTCAVSGGADSLALLVLAAAAGCRRDRRPRRPRAAAGLGRRSRRRAGGGAAVRRRLPGRAGRGRRRAEPRGPGAGSPRRRAAAPACSPATPPTTRPRPCCSTCCGARGLDGLAGMRAGRPSAPRPAAGRDPRPVRRPRARHRSRTRRTSTRPTCATGSATSCCRSLDAIAERDVAALLARQAGVARRRRRPARRAGRRHRPHRRPRRWRPPRPALARRAVRRWLADPYPPDAGRRRAGAGRGPRRGAGLRGGRWPPGRASAPAPAARLLVSGAAPSNRAGRWPTTPELGEVIVGAGRPAGPRRRARGHDRRRLRRPRSAAHRRAQGRLRVHGRPDPGHPDAGRDRLHGRAPPTDRPPGRAASCAS